MKSQLQILVTILLLCSIARGENMTGIGNWTFSLSAANLTNGAGSNFLGSAESISGTTVLSLGGVGSQTWTVVARRGAGTWDSGVTILVRRTSDGTGPGNGTISGGQSYIELTTSNTILFTGNKARDGVTIQYKVMGLSVRTPAATYTSPVIFSIL